jgi:hypothetical protein
MLKRFEELRRAAGNSELRAAYQAAIDGLDGVLYRLAMLRAPGLPAATRRSPLLPCHQRSRPRPSERRPARIVVARKPRRR